MDYISESLAAGLIRPSYSPAGAGFFLVGKKGRRLNITVKNWYPFPHISLTFEVLQSASIFSKLNLPNGHHLVCISKGDKWKMAYNTPYKYLLMCFGLSNAPAVFHNLENDVLRDMINKFVIVYLNDILIFSRSQAQHTHHTRAILQCLSQTISM